MSLIRMGLYKFPVGFIVQIVYENNITMVDVTDDSCSILEGARSRLDFWHSGENAKVRARPDIA